MNDYIQLLSTPKLQNKWYPVLGDRYIHRNQPMVSHLLDDHVQIVNSAFLQSYTVKRAYLVSFIWLPRIEDYIRLQKWRPFQEVINEALAYNYNTLEECLAVQYLNWLNTEPSCKLN